MTDSLNSAQPLCPNCHGLVAAGGRFCQHCAAPLPSGNATSFTVPPPAPPTAILEDTLVPTAARRANPSLLVGALLVCALAALAFFLYRSRAHSATASNVAIATATMGARAQQVEGRILQGATLAEAELAGLSAYELRVLRNTHFARYGRVYERPGLGDYFYTRSWYRPSADYSDKQITATDKANINLILALEQRAKAAEAANITTTPAASTAPPITTSGGGLASLFSSSALTNDKVQRAVDAMLEFTRKEGAARVIGVQEIPQQNQAKVDLRFENFQYVASEMGTPVSKTKTTPRAPDINSPNYWQEMSDHVMNQVKVTRYAGDGAAILKHYNDGRWVLTEIHFGFNGVSGNIEVR